MKRQRFICQTCSLSTAPRIHLPPRWYSVGVELSVRGGTGFMCPKCSCEHAGRKLGELMEGKPQPPKKRYSKGRNGWPMPTKWELRYLMELEAWHAVRWGWLAVLMLSEERPIKYKTGKRGWHVNGD